MKRTLSLYISATVPKAVGACSVCRKSNSNSNSFKFQFQVPIPSKVGVGVGVGVGVRVGNCNLLRGGRGVSRYCCMVRPPPRATQNPLKFH